MFFFLLRTVVITHLNKKIAANYTYRPNSKR